MPVAKAWVAMWLALHATTAVFATKPQVALKQTIGQPDACGTPPPGFEIFEPGYDLSDIDLLNLDNMNWKRPAITVSCQPGNTYVNDYNKKTYQIPDQLNGVPLNIGGVVTEAFSILVNDSQTFRQQLSKTISTSVFWGLFSHSTTVSEVFQFLANESVYAGVRSSHVSAYQMGLHQPYRADIMNLSSDCQWLADALPESFNETTFDAYEQMIDTCGTDYLNSAILGCKLQYRHFTGTGKIDIMTQGDVDLNAGLDFLNFLKAMGAIEGNVSVVSDTYLNYTVNSTTCYGGGTACPHDSGSFQDWIATCPSEPVFVSGKFTSLGSLIRDDSRAAGFENARNNHFRRAFLQNEFIPLCKLIVDVVNSPVAFNDTGGDCAGAPACPADGTGCDPAWECKCDGKSHGCGQFGNFSCPNPVFGAELNSTANSLRENITEWTSNIHSLITEAEAALEGSNVVSNGTVVALGLQFVDYMLRVQRPLRTQHCGYTFNVFEQPCTMTCNPAIGTMAGQNITTRNLTYIPILDL